MAAPELDGFRLLEPIAQGGLSTVWRARHASGFPAAVKILRQFGTLEESDRFANEIRAVAGLAHPGIVRILDVGRAARELVLPTGLVVRKGTPWLAMEYVGGGTLTVQHVDGWDTLAFVARSILETLAHAHARGVVHRDLKPANLLLVDPRRPRAGVKLTDFGIAWTQADTPEASPTGTLDYMAPEQIEVFVRRYGPWTDLYGLGCLLYELATGSPPFRDEPDRPLAMGHLVATAPPMRPRFAVPPAFEAWTLRMLAKEPHDRFRTAGEAHEALFGERPRPAPDGTRGRATQRLFGLRDIPLVGRIDERRRLVEAATEADRAVVVTLRGPEGVGRSRLLRWLDHELAEASAAVTFPVRPIEGGDEVAAAILARTGATGLTGEELREQLDWWSGPDVDAELRRELGHVLAPPPERRVEPDERARVVARWLAALATRRRVAWLVDDAPACLDALRVAAALCADPSRPATLIVLAAADSAASPAAWEAAARDATEIRLGPLDREERLVLLQRAVAVDPSLAARIDDETHGHLVTAIELLRDAVERGWLVAGPEGLRLAPGRDVVVPGDRLGPFASRLDRLLGEDDDASAQLELAAALGEDVSMAAWDAVGGYAAADRRRRLLDALLSARLAEVAPNGFRFAHPAARSAVLRRASLHGRYKEAHRSCLLWAQATGASAERVARHLVALESWAEAAEPLLEAVRERLERDGPGAATTLLRTADDAIERAGLPASDRRALRAKVLHAEIVADQGQHREALASLDALLPELSGPRVRKERVRADVVRGECLALTGQNEDAIELLTNLDEGPGVEDALRLRVRDALTRLCIRMGRYKEAAAHAGRSEELLDGSGLQGLRGLNLLRRAGIAVRRDDPEGARELLARAEPLLERYGSLQQRAILANEKAGLIHRLESAEKAEPWFERAIELSRAAGYRPSWAAINLAVCKLERRRVDEAEAIVQEVGVASMAPGSGPATAGALVLAVCHALTGRWSAFDRALDKAEVGLLAQAEPDNAHLLERAAAEVEAQGQVSRGQRCRRLAEAQRSRLTAAGS